MARLLVEYTAVGLSRCVRWIYRLFVEVDGVDTDFRFLKRDSDLDHTLTDITPGTTISAYVIAANPGGEAIASPTVTKIVGAT